MVTVLFNNGARTFKNSQNDPYLMDSLKNHLENIILNRYNQNYINVKQGNIKSICLRLEEVTKPFK